MEKLRLQRESNLLRLTHQVNRLGARGSLLPQFYFVSIKEENP
jgi:hypothetical protein